jgi:hypothetical protein
MAAKKAIKQTYDDLFDYVFRRLAETKCDDTLKFTKQFAEKHGLDFGKLSQFLGGYGSSCDCRIMLNGARFIDPDMVIGQETVPTPAQYASQHELYCNDWVDGTPVSPEEAVDARKAGREVRFHMSCMPNDPFAILDIGRALRMLEEERKERRQS